MLVVMKVNRASDGRANLHIWREGREYWCQKSPVFLREWTNVQFSLVPRPAVILLDEGGAQLMERRETVEDVLRRYPIFNE